MCSVGEEVYLALDKGPINPAHALLVPIEHLPSWAALGEGAAAEVEAYLSALRAHAAAQVGYRGCLGTGMRGPVL